ncbi:cobalamin-binding protein [Chlorobium sp.]|uniref:cobalamin-binding protein n=1 Tax=Chlorobium sp. TaxID=1095 RepID=UPI0025C017BF|nr:cobalamin-binding protein [Chlorobium sp.]
MKSENRAIFLLFFVSLFLIAGCRKGETPKQNKEDDGPRIISLAPSVTEMIFAVGAGKQLAGRTSACDWPAEAAEVPVIGAFGRPSMEMLASIHPDIVINVDLEDERNSDKIRGLGIRTERIDCKTPDDIPAALRTIGRLTGHERKADSLASVIEKGLEEFRSHASRQAKKPLVYLEIWDDPFWTGGKESYTSALIAYAGGRNIGDSVSKEYFEISQEWVIEQNPEVIACMYMSKEAPAAEGVLNRPGWQHIDAIKQKRVFDGLDNSLFLRPGPRVLEGIAQLKSLMEKK